MKAFALALVLVVAGSASLRAEVKADAKATLSVADDKPVNKKCPVSGKDINPECTSKYKDFVVAFCCGGCKGKFDKEPEKFIKNIELPKK